MGNKIEFITLITNFGGNLASFNYQVWGIVSEDIFFQPSKTLATP